MEILALRHQIMVLERQLVAPGHCPALAPRPARTPPCGPVAAQVRGPAADRALNSCPGAALGAGESQRGPSPPARRTACAWHQGGRIHGVKDVEGSRDNPAPERACSTWTDFLRSQAQALLACDFLETVTLTGTRLYVLAVIEHANRRVRVLGATAHPTASWVAQAAKNLVMDLEDAGCRAQFLIRDRVGSSQPCSTPFSRTQTSTSCSAESGCPA